MSVTLLAVNSTLERHDMRFQYPNSVATVLEMGARYIETHGWHQGSLTPYNARGIEWACQLFDDGYQGPVCAVGSIYGAGARPRTTMFTVAIGAMEDYLEEWSLPGWNDAQGRTAEEVIDTMRRCALEIRAGNIGDDQKEYEFEPFPDTEPVKEPSVPTPAPAPVREPEPAHS